MVRADMTRTWIVHLKELLQQSGTPVKELRMGLNYLLRYALSLRGLDAQAWDVTIEEELEHE